MREIYFGDFRSYVVEQIKLIEKIDYERDAPEWFLLRYLRRVVKSMEGEYTPGRVAGSMRSLVRFYVDNIDTRSELGEQCLGIYDQYRRTLRENQVK